MNVTINLTINFRGHVVEVDGGPAPPACQRLPGGQIDGQRLIDGQIDGQR